ncbi:MAG TPA: hypothetical protein VL738_18945 [Dactylosporangium sp.]|nr:hypothetical protein [Dactylosporangium sp.]
MSVLRAAAVDVIGGAVVLVGLALIVHEAGVLSSAVRRTGRRGATTVEALRASAANDGRCLLVGRLRDASDPPTPPRSGRRVAWYRRQHTREYEDTTGEFPVVRSFTIAIDTGPGSIVLDDGTGLALVPPRLIHPDRWGPVTVKSPDIREWTIPDGVPLVFIGRWRRCGDRVELAGSRAWPADAVATRAGARFVLLMRAAAAALRVLMLGLMVAGMTYVIIGVSLGRFAA